MSLHTCRIVILLFSHIYIHCIILKQMLISGKLGQTKVITTLSLHNSLGKEVCLSLFFLLCIRLTWKHTGTLDIWLFIHTLEQGVSYACLLVDFHSRLVVIYFLSALSGFVFHCVVPRMLPSVTRNGCSRQA